MGTPLPLDQGLSRRTVLRAGARAFAVVTALLVLYYLLPIESRPHHSVVLRVGVGLAVFIFVLSLETVNIGRADQPMVRAGVALATVLPLFVVIFAWIYLTLSRSDPAAFSEHLNRTASLYFTLSVFSTVGFGDIVPKTDAARLVTSAQMVADLLVLAVVVRVIIGAATRTTRQRTEGTD